MGVFRNRKNTLVWIFLQYVDHYVNVQTARYPGQIALKIRRATNNMQNLDTMFTQGLGSKYIVMFTHIKTTHLQLRGHTQ